jgi:CRISPR-associated protein Csb2
MTTIRLTFPAGRYHGTPWGRHVNEGVAEWPPSPYRLLRALFDVWQRKCFDLLKEDIEAALEELARSAPRFTLPQVAATHTRSYLSANSKDPTDKNLVFDAFVVFDRPQVCFVTWPELDLTPRSKATLSRLLPNLNYLGRSESWIDAEIWDGPGAEGIMCHPADTPDASGDLHPVACVVPRSEYKEGARWLEALAFSTTSLIKERASSPPLLRQVRYARPAGAVMTEPPRRIVRRTPDVQAILLSLDATVLPLVTTTLEVAEQIRVRLMGGHKRSQGGDETLVSPLFSGKAADGTKRMDHGHLYILPLGNHLGRIDRVLLISPLAPLTPDEMDAVRGVRELYQRDGRPGVRCVVTWQGPLEAPVVRKKLKTVVSRTPFVAPRHWRKGRDFKQFLETEVRRECSNHRISAMPSEIEVLPSMPGLFDAVEYRRNRKQDPVRPGYALKLTFPEDVVTPFALGYGAHFGLGQFGMAEAGRN